MPITLEIQPKQLNNPAKLALHHLPAKIEGEGTANVEEYFNQYTRTENGVLYNALRGYPLNGLEQNVPANYKGLVIQEPPNGEQHDRKLRVTGTFEKFTYWNYDKAPSKADAYVQALQWTELANQLSTPITEDEILTEIEAYKQEIAGKENK